MILQHEDKAKDKAKDEDKKVDDNDEKEDGDEQLFGGVRAKRTRTTVVVPVGGADIIASFLVSPERVYSNTHVSAILHIYTVLTVHTAECERGVSSLKRIHTEFRNRLTQETLEQLLYVNP